MGIEITGNTLHASNSMTHGISIPRKQIYINKSPMGTKVRKQSIARAQKLLDSRETDEFKEKNAKINQFLFTRGDANEPCFHCVAKRIRASQVEKL